MMGLLQKAVETYDAMAYRAGQIYEGEKEPLAPISHTLIQPNIEITLDQNGNFLSARTVGAKEAKIIIPVTESSVGRTSTSIRPHPLCDQLGYLVSYNTNKYTSYVNQLETWANNSANAKLQSILHYIQSNTILTDLVQSKVIQTDAAGNPQNEKLVVCWIVNGLGQEQSGPCWTDPKLMQSFINYHSAQNANKNVDTCMVSGQTEPLTEQHIKGIVAKHGNAKLISNNDDKNFTYLGRFTTAEQAATVGYTASQKAHNALRWLVSNQGVTFEKRTFLCWNPQGIKLPPIHGPMARKSSQRAADPTQYRQQLWDTLTGWKHDLPEQAEVILAAFDAATKGRLSVTYYNELQASDFLDRLYFWEDTCKWPKGPFGIQSPTLFQIITMAFGTLKNEKFEPDSRVLSQQMQRIISCRIDCTAFPLDIVQNLVEKASNLQICTAKKPEDTQKLRENLLFTACAVIRKYHFDHFKEDWDMALDKNCNDRSYLFGRLLAVAEAVENSTYSKENTRETNALKMQKAFSLRPMAVWRTLEERLELYYKQLKPGLQQYYRRTVQEIVDKLEPSDKGLNQKLDDIYLLGYYHQRAYRKEKPKADTEE